LADNLFILVSQRLDFDRWFEIEEFEEKIEIGMFNLADRPCDLINRTNSPLIVFYPKYFQLFAVKKSRL